MKGVEQSAASGAAVGILARALDRPDLGRAAMMTSVLPYSGPVRILVMGVVKRGKSTLVNELLGVKVSPVRVLPETLGLIAYPCVTSRPRAWSVEPDGRIRKLPAETRRFRRRIARGVGHRSDVTVRFGRYRTPRGVTLIDTVGESEASDQQADSSGLVPDDVVASAAGIIVVFGVPGVSATDVQLLERVTRARLDDPTAVLFIIKSVDSAVKLQDLADFRAELAQVSTIAECASRAVLIREGDLGAIKAVRNWMNFRMRETAAPSLRGSEDFNWQAELNSEIDARLARSGPGIRLPDGLLTQLPEALRGPASSVTIEAFQARHIARIRSEYEVAYEIYSRAAATWSSEQTNLINSLTPLRADYIAAQERFKKASSGDWGPGCLLLGMLPFSLFFFPFGPFVVGGIYWFWYTAREEAKSAAAHPYQVRMAELDAQLRSINSQLALHQKARPVPPVVPPELQPTMPKRWWRRSKNQGEREG